jgi:tetratricopeptide (TPR) repeat protein
MAEGEFALMQQHLETALKLSSSAGAAPAGDHDVYAMLVDGAAQQRDPVGLQKYALLAEETARSIDHKLHLAIAYRAWGVAHTLAGEYPQAEARFKQALDIFDDYPAPWQIGRSLFEMGELARLQMKPEQARDYYSRALSAFEELHAAPYAARARAALENVSRV